MNRRGFFASIAGLVAGAALDPERLLWRPGAKLISIPKPTVDIDEVGISIRRRYDMATGKCWLEVTFGWPPVHLPYGSVVIRG